MRDPGAMVESIIDVIGSTPMVRLGRFTAARSLEGRIGAKLEYLSPGASKKDRIALEMIREARASGTLAPGQTVIELTSGNTGTGLAIVCRALGHPFIAVMSRGNSVERTRMMRSLGAEVELVDQASASPPNQVSGEDLELVERRATELERERGAFRVDQFAMEANVLAHFRHTGPEIWRQMRGEVDVFVDFVGTGGSFTGVMRYLTERNPAIRGYIVEPAAAPALAGRSTGEPSHRIQGGGYGRTDLALVDRSLVGGYLAVTDEEAGETTRALAAEEGIFAGYSTGANVAAACRLLATSEPGASVAVIACDSGLKYLSTDLFP